MTDIILKMFIKDYKNIHNPAVRLAYGKLSGKIGIVCNILLFIMKAAIGAITNSVSITADAVNNLSDAASSIISLIGFKIAEKPADREHPYGHARSEYFAGLTIAVLIIIIGIEMLKTGIEKILNPSEVAFNTSVVAVLLISIAIKLWMTLFNRALSIKINSTTIEATSADSRNDVISTFAVLVASVVSYFSGLQLDGIMGIAVAIFVLYSGFGLIRDTLDPLLGRAPEPELVEYIKNKIMSYDGILDTHDLMIHDYGPGRKFASVHVEMAAERNVLESHNIIDNIEHDFLEKDNLNIIVHYDPIVTEKSEMQDMRGWLEERIKAIDSSLSIHDLRIVKADDCTKLIFDCVVSPEMTVSTLEINNRIQEQVNEKYDNYRCLITFDASFDAMPHSK